MPFRENLDSSSSLLVHFSPPSERLPSPPEPKTCSPTDSTPLEEESATSETTEVRTSREEELEGSDGASDTETDHRAAETETERLDHRRLWEAGQIDYLGIDAFKNIQKMLDRFLD